MTGGDVNGIDDFLVLDEWDAIAWSDENILSNAIFDNWVFTAAYVQL